MKLINLSLVSTEQVGGTYINMTIKFKKLHEDAIIPQYQTKGSAGFDFHALNDGCVFGSPDRRVIVGTGLAIEIPEGYELDIRPRSGLAFKNSITVLNSPGTIDSDYRGEVKILLINHGEEDFVFKKGDRIAQGVILKVEQIPFEVVDELSDTTRGEGGMGSTGK